MIDRLKRWLLGESTSHEGDEPVDELLNIVADSGYAVGAEMISKGESEEYTVRVAFETADGREYDPGDTISGVLRQYEGSMTIKKNVLGYVSEYGEIPITDSGHSPEPANKLLSRAMVPGEYISTEEPNGEVFLVVPKWEDEWS